MAKKNWIKIERDFATDPQHRIKMGMKIWLYLYILDRADWETGKINNWRDQDAADEMNMPLRTIRDQRQGLEEEKYIQCLQRGQFQVIIIFNYHNPRAYDGEVLNRSDEFNPIPIFFEGDKKMSLESPEGNTLLSLVDEGDTQGNTEGDTQGDSKSVTLPLISHTTIPIDQDNKPTAKKLWIMVLQELSFKVSRVDFDQWLRPLTCLDDHSQELLRVVACNKFQKEYVDKKYFDTIERIIQIYWPDAEFQVVIQNPELEIARQRKKVS